MDKPKDYEPMMLDLQKTQRIGQPKAYLLLFIVSVCLFGLLMIFAVLYFQRPFPNLLQDRRRNRFRLLPLPRRPPHFLRRFPRQFPPIPAKLRQHQRHLRRQRDGLLFIRILTRLK